MIDSNNKNSKVVALVNKKEIIQEELDFYAKQIATMQKMPLPDKETEEGKKFERQALDQVINEILLLKDAENKKIVVEKEEIDKQYNDILTQIGGEEKLNEALKDQKITIDALRKDLARQKTREKYFNFIKEEENIVVSDDELKSFYDEYVAKQKPELNFEVIKPQIKQEIELQKLSHSLSKIINDLREKAEIEILL